MPQLRQNIITGEWVVFAPERAKRPSDYIYAGHKTKQGKSDCPFCEQNGGSFDNRIIQFDKDTTYLSPNKFPAFIEDPDGKAGKLFKIEDEFYRMKLSLGGHDVVVVRDHDQQLPQFTGKIWQDLFETFKDRYLYYGKIENVQYVMPITNHGPEAAASLDHPHAQIFASSIVPNIAARELSYTKQYFEENHSCPFCDLIEHEKKQNTRVLFENDDFICFTFYAARFPFETWILPKRHQSRFEKATAGEIDKLSKICREIFSRYYDVLGNPPLNFFIHSAPLHEKELKHYHWHLEITPRLSNYGGFEIGSGVIIDIIAPEQAAEYLRLGRANS